MSSSFTTNAFLVFLRLLSFSSPYRFELNQTIINQIQHNLIKKQASTDIFNISLCLQVYTQ